MIDVLLRDNFVAGAVQAGLLALAAAPLPRLLGVWSPRARLAYWRIVMVACVALPLLQPRVALDRADAAPAPSSLAVLADADAGPSGDDGRRGEAWGLRLPRATLGGVVAAGAAIRLAWLALGLLVLSRLRRGAARLWPRTPAVDEAVEAAGADAEFLVSPRALRPMTFGFARPVVLVPADFSRFPHDHQRAIACHELLHVKRLDWLRAVGDEVVRSFAWFHPAAWWLTGQVHLSREQLVDEQVVRRLGVRRQYLEALLHLASTDGRGGLLPASLFLGRAHLPQRVALLVKEVRMSRPRLVLSFAAMTLVLALSGGAAVVAFPLHRAPDTAAGVVQEPDAKGPIVQRIRHARPEYPADVPVETPSPWIFEVTVDAAGGVADVASMSGTLTRVAEAAADALRRWTFTPPPAAPHRMLVGFNLAAGRNDGPGRTPVLVGDEIAPPVKVHHVKPVYTKEALDAGVQGVVIVEALIDSDGLVSEARVLRSVPLLDRPALDAALQWRFTPRGAPVEATFTINFTLSDGPPREVKGAGGESEADYVRVGRDTGIAPPKKVTDVRPVYPAAAKEQGIEGVVVIEAAIEPDGRVGRAKVLRSVPDLDQAALDAVKQWEFAPTLKNGIPVGVVMTVTVNFMLK